MLSLESPAVAPLNPVAVGDGWFFWDDDLDGTYKRPRLFLKEETSSTDEVSLSLELSCGFWEVSSKSRDISFFGMRGRIDYGGGADGIQPAVK